MRDAFYLLRKFTCALIMTQIEEFSLGRGVLASLDALNFSIRHNLNPRASFSWPCSEMFLQMERDKSFLQGEQFCLLVVARIRVFVANYFKYKLIKTQKCFLWLRFAICVKIPDLVSQGGGRAKQKLLFFTMTKKIIKMLSEAGGWFDGIFIVMTGDILVI